VQIIDCVPVEDMPADEPSGVERVAAHGSLGKRKRQEASADDDGDHGDDMMDIDDERGARPWILYVCIYNCISGVCN
jgi:hypothetical protein